jgi:hypothetical protein
MVKAFVGHLVHCKLLKGLGLHNFVAMVGYCLKDAWKEHFKVVNDIDVKKNASIDEYTKFGATST